ncbi:hypothetical protein LR48_Vigan11g156000 [Vigna angularis]|uniref:Uncharacterized protein n=1 Tax=Phaseolus angularis TaxID=3914 RepID=A0A0L9VTX4_PHAAN|nr:hypothetical protein LR48_Vigan11g156000 [Vigna angularis]
MYIVLLSSSEESEGKGGQGYVDYVSSSSVSSVRSSIFRSTKRDIESGDVATDVNMNNVIVRDNVREVVVIDVDATGESTTHWSGSRSRRGLKIKREQSKEGQPTLGPIQSKHFGAHRGTEQHPHEATKNQTHARSRHRYFASTPGINRSDYLMLYKYTDNYSMDLTATNSINNTTDVSFRLSPLKVSEGSLPTCCSQRLAVLSSKVRSPPLKVLKGSLPLKTLCSQRLAVVEDLPLLKALPHSAVAKLLSKTRPRQR